MKRHFVYLLAAVFALAGLSLFAFKAYSLGLPLLPGQTAGAWRVEATVRFQSGPGSIRATLRVPTLTPGYLLADEISVAPGYGFSIDYTTGGREAQWAIRRADGPQALYYRALLYEDRSRDRGDTTPPFPPPPQLEEPYKTATETLIRDVHARSAEPVSFTTELLRQLNDSAPEPHVSLLLSRANNRTDFVNVAVQVLAAARYPARLVRGIELSDRQRNADVLPFLEMHDSERWIYFDPISGEPSLPDDFLVWWRGQDPLVQVDGGSNVEVNLAVQRDQLGAEAVAEERARLTRSRALEFSVFGLPIKTQAVYAVLLTIPIGALVMVFLRNIVGLESFGTFLPVLVALAFRETQLLWGLILFTLLLSLGLTIRFLLERLRLLLVPRLTAVLVIVVLLMLAISVLSHRLGIESGLSVALFPMVIIAMAIERMSVLWEERGAGDAIKAAIGTLIVAALAYLVMGLDVVEHLVVTFPELLLVVLAIVLVIGRYTGFRLTELTRFKALAKDNAG
ncbi:MAG: UUP1 family membrane protein [Pseudomonadota bacterium]